MDTRSSKEQFDLVKEKSLRLTLVRSCRVICWHVYSDETLPPMTLDLTLLLLLCNIVIRRLILIQTMYLSRAHSLLGTVDASMKNLKTLVKVS